VNVTKEKITEWQVFDVAWGLSFYFVASCRSFARTAPCGNVIFIFFCWTHASCGATVMLCHCCSYVTRCKEIFVAMLCLSFLVQRSLA